MRVEKKLVKDVVCGMVKPQNEMKAKTLYKGKAYYFCWEGDRKMFEEHPEHWIDKSK